MDNIILLFSCLIVGMILRRYGRVPENAHTSLNMFIIHISLPALILFQIHNMQFNTGLLYAIAMPWIVFVMSIALFCLIGVALKLNKNTVGALGVVSGLGNTSFIGLPMIETFYGADKMQLGIIIDQLGTYLVLSTLGVLTICFYAGEGSISNREIAKRVITFLPLIALIVALCLLPLSYPAWFSSVLLRLGNTLAPLALVSVGLQLKMSALPGNKLPLSLGIAYKLVIAPFVIGVLYIGLLGLRGVSVQVTLLEAAMAPQIGGSIVAIQYGLDAKLITLLVGIGTFLSFLTLPFWWDMFFYI
ncbi:AEC family transporter [Methylobacterium sp. JK268]